MMKLNNIAPLASSGLLATCSGLFVCSAVRLNKKIINSRAFSFFVPPVGGTKKRKKKIK